MRREGGVVISTKRNDAMGVSGHMRRMIGGTVLVLGIAAAVPTWATHESRPVGNFDADESKDIEEIVREYLLSHPEVIFESVQRLQVQQQQAEEERRRAAAGAVRPVSGERSEEHTSELQSLMRISYAVFCLKQKKHT